jgi:hypothetical protein
MVRKPRPPLSAQKPTALYHIVYATETFEDAAEKIWAILCMAQEKTPGAPRWLFLDIEGHRNEAGGLNWWRVAGGGRLQLVVGGAWRERGR